VLSQVDVLHDAVVVVDDTGVITVVAEESELSGAERALVDTAAADAACVLLDCSEYVVLPGLVDGHTHPVWAGDRCREFARKLAGETYMDIHASGGGIALTVAASVAASESELLQSLLARMDRALRLGTTLMEAKSGYGLTLEAECKLMRVLKAAQQQHPVELVVTYCGAHSVPRGAVAAAVAAHIVAHDIPDIVRRRGQGEITPELIDVFCEKGVFGLPETKAILTAG
jgi:imidazolonepropionase